ncbi:MAG: hypothetical protein EU521_00615, partial [Promethearchaeota archaeon]
EIPKRVQDYLKENLSDNKSINLIFPENADIINLNALAPDAHIMIGWRPTENILKYAKNLEVFICPGAGVKHLIDLFRNYNKHRQSIGKQKIIFTNNHGNSYNVAQHAVALLLSYMNKIIPHHLWMEEGKWRTGDEDAASVLLRYKRIGLLGYGAINKKVHRFLSGFDVEFFILRKHWNKQDFDQESINKKFKPSDLHEFLNLINILIIAIPETSSTIGLIGSKELKLLGKKGILVNVSRGSIVDEKSLYKALKKDFIKGAAIDVWYERDPEADENGRRYPYHYPFHDLDNIILSPHRGYSPFDDLLRWNPLIENLKRFSQGRRDLLNIIDLKEEY